MARLLDQPVFIGCFLQDLREEGSYDSLQVHVLTLNKDFHKELKNVFDILGGSIVEDFEQDHSILDEYINSVLRVGFADGPNHSDALVREGPMSSFYIAVDLVEKRLVELRNWQVLVFVLFVDVCLHF